MQAVLLKFGQRISELRQKRGLTQEKLAVLLQYSPNHISKIESARTNPSFDLIVRIADILDVDIKDLFNFDEHKNNTEIKEQLNFIINKIDNKDLKIVYKIINSIYS